MIARKLSEMKPELLKDARLLNLTVKIVGITGRFFLPTLLLATNGSNTDPQPSTTQNLVWFACGIGFTPFLSMLTFLRDTVISDTQVHLIHSTREPAILLPILISRLQRSANADGELNLPLDVTPANPNIRLTVDILLSQSLAGLTNPPAWTHVRQYPQRLDTAFIERCRDELLGKDIYICGPNDYVRMIVGTLTKIGVNADRMRTESFTY